jgi:hypothetical protein
MLLSLLIPFEGVIIVPAGNITTGRKYELIPPAIKLFVR